MSRSIPQQGPSYLSRDRSGKAAVAQKGLPAQGKGGDVNHIAGGWRERESCAVGIPFAGRGAASDSPFLLLHRQVSVRLFPHPIYTVGNPPTASASGLPLSVSGEQQPLLPSSLSGVTGASVLLLFPSFLHSSSVLSSLLLLYPGVGSESGISVSQNYPPFSPVPPDSKSDCDGDGGSAGNNGVPYYLVTGAHRRPNR